MSRAARTADAMDHSQRDSMSHHIVSPGAGMWLDDALPSSLVPGASSLEDSLHLLHAHGNAHGALSFDDDHEVHAMFPMLSESSFDYNDDKVTPLTLSITNNTGTTPTVGAIDAAFPADLSPILAPTPTPTHAIVTNTLAPRKKKNASTKKTHSRVEIVAPMSVLAPPAAVTRKRRRHDVTTLSQWSTHEQNVFFSVFKSKWPANSALSVDAATPEFIAMLRQRCELISHKLAATRKTPEDVQQLYHDVLQVIIDLLALVIPHDINLLNPDEIRVALWCWYKMNREDNQTEHDRHGNVDSARVARELQQSIVRSRRQMLKAKNIATAVQALASHPPPAQPEDSTPLFDDEAVKEMVSLEGILREALEHPSLPSYLFQLAPQPVLDAGAQPVVHHPLVRKKATKTPTVDTISSTTTNPAAKRKRSESIELYHAFTSGTPLEALASTPNADAATPEFVTPPVQVRSKKAKTAPTPPPSTRKKMHIKLRMVPRDAQTKDMVEQCGCNPKVELKLSSSKKVSDVLDHMAKKWAKVRALVDKNATLHFFQKEVVSTPVTSPSPSSTSTMEQGATTTRCWSRATRDETCLDIWKQCGKMKGDEHIVVVLYQWRVVSNVPASSLLHHQLDGSSDDVMKQIPFDDAFLTSSSADNTPVASPAMRGATAITDSARVQPLPSTGTSKQSLLAFSETVAFDSAGVMMDEDEHNELSLTSLPDDALNELMELSPNSQRLRRRITPVLVQTNECQI